MPNNSFERCLKAKLDSIWQLVEGAKKEVDTEDDPKFLTQTTGGLIEPSLQETLEEEEIRDQIFSS